MINIVGTEKLSGKSDNINRVLNQIEIDSLLGFNLNNVEYYKNYNGGVYVLRFGDKEFAKWFDENDINVIKIDDGKNYDGEMIVKFIEDSHFVHFKLVWM